VIKVLKEIDADVIGLQEVVSIPEKKIETDQQIINNIFIKNSFCQRKWNME
jgi:hypothetical protein